MPGNMLAKTCDVLVVGAGVVGLTLALELRKRRPKATVVVIDKEDAAGEHASGRNSGVLHAGFYYTANSLKARLTRDGNRLMAAWCEEHGIPVRRCGKLVVARDQSEHEGLDELLRRADANGVRMEAIGEREALEIEPHVKTCQRALYSPDTCAVDPRKVLARLQQYASEECGIKIIYSTSWLGLGSSGSVATSRGDIDCGLLVNAAGLYADRIAQAYGFGERYRMLPFKGLYLYGNEAAPQLRTHIYPVPDLAMPFLGVHFTVTAAGRTKIGPTAIPAFWREDYAERLLQGFSARELAEVVHDDMVLFANDARFRRHAMREPWKILRRVLVRHAAHLAKDIRVADFKEWGRPGIRAQLFDRVEKRLVMDFCFEGDEKSLHILNAVSPAFTCSWAFAKHVLDSLEGSDQASDEMAISAKSSAQDLRQDKRRSVSNGS
jgi:(S)-2-hydroxyglutarate dehydrogenase